MLEIYRDSINKAITLDIAGASNVGASAIYLGLTSPLELDVVPFQNTYAARIPYSITSRDRLVNVTWTYYVEGEMYTKKESFSVVTPLVTDDDVEEFDQELESLVRFFIEEYTGNFFGLERKTLTVRATGGEFLALPRVVSNIYSLSSIQGNYNIQSIRIQESGLAISIINDYDDPVLLPDESVSPQGEIIYAPSTKYYFKEGLDFTVEADWGYSSVPRKVKQAAKLLYADFSCLDAGYRNKYIQEFKNINGGFKFSGRAFNGTGNLTADLFLDAYKMVGIGII